jgi:hypothetical protein
VPDPVVVTRLRQFKASLARRDDLQMIAMGQRWQQVERALADQVMALAQDVHDRGGLVSRGEFDQLERAQALLAQAEAEYGKYAAYADGLITTEQRARVELALRHAQEAIQLSYWPANVAANFRRLPVRAVENMAGLAGDGGPIGALLKRSMLTDTTDPLGLPAIWERLTQTLINSTAQGINPRTTARLMAADLQGGRQKAEVIARTEQIRVYRLASTEQFRESGVVTGFRRLSARGPRTCLGCQALDGEHYDIGQELGDHPDGMCTLLPECDGAPFPQYQTGADYVASLPDTAQQGILGRYYDGYAAGDFKFSDLGQHTHDPVWGQGVSVTPLEQLSKAA